MPVQRAWVVHGASGWDEATPIGPFLVYEVSEGAIERREVDPQRFGIERCEASALAGGDAAANLTALRRVFEGNDRGAHLSALLLQAGMALTIAGRAASIDAGMALARSAIDSGAASAWLRRLQQFASGLKRPGTS
jgi:anthranilate phosphoribosyltransferase